MTVEQDVVRLQQDIERLNREIKLYRDPFSRPEQLKLEQGATGAARYRKLPLIISSSETSVRDAHGTLSEIAHIEMPDAAQTKAHFHVTPLPIDYIAGGYPTINWMYSTSGTTGNNNWTVLIESLKDETTNPDTLYSVLSLDAVPSVANSIDIISKPLTNIPEKGTYITGYVSRRANTGSDTNDGESTAFYAIWIEYLAFI